MTPKVLHGPWQNHHRMALLYERARLELDDIQAQTGWRIALWERKKAIRKRILKALLITAWLSFVAAATLSVMK